MSYFSQTLISTVNTVTHSINNLSNTILTAQMRGDYMSGNRLVLVEHEAVAKEPLEVHDLSSTSLWYSPHSPFFTREENDVSMLYRHIFFPNKL